MKNGRCRPDRDCRKGEVFKNGRCRRDRDSDEDGCRKGEVFKNGRCRRRRGNNNNNDDDRDEPPNTYGKGGVFDDLTSWTRVPDEEFDNSDPENDEGEVEFQGVDLTEDED
jgi:hypothetical protein